MPPQPNVVVEHARVQTAPPAAGVVGRPEWQVVGASVRGASHVRTGLPNQDALRWLPASGAGPPLVVAIADGHGSAKCFRSEKGASLAVETATQVIDNVLRASPDHGELANAPGHSCITPLTAELVCRWKAAVEDDLRQTPFAVSELAALERRDGRAARHVVEATPLLAYGATLAAVLLTRAFILYLQLGDGDILTVSDTGEVARPVPTDARLFGGETTSLCSARADHDFRIGLHALPGASGGALPCACPALILLSTDGYANSFRNDDGFLKVGSDMLEMTRAMGLDVVKTHLQSWLGEASQLGSGDDVTLGMVCRKDVWQKPVAPMIPEQHLHDERVAGLDVVACPAQ